MSGPEEVADVVRRVGDQTVVGPAPVGLLLREGRRSRRRRRLAAVGAVVAVAVLAGGGLALGVNRFSGSSTGPATGGEQGPCASLRVWLSTPERNYPISPGGNYRPTVGVHVGDSVSVEATGGCAGTVGATSENDRVLRSLARTRFAAVDRGTARLAVSMPMCAGSGPDCRGGISDLAVATVAVTGR